MEQFRDKIFNEEVFEQYTKKLPSTKENSLIKNGLFNNVNKYKAKFANQTGGYAVVEPFQRVLKEILSSKEKLLMVEQTLGENMILVQT